MPHTEANAATRPKLGEILCAAGELTTDQLANALAQQSTLQLPLGQTLLKLGYTTDEIMRQALSTQLGVPYIDLGNVIIDRSLAQLVDVEFARRHGLLPVARIGSTLTVAMDDPTATSVVRELSVATDHTVTVVTSSAQAIARALNRLYDRQPSAAARPAWTSVAVPQSAPAPVTAQHGYAALLGLSVRDFQGLLRAVEDGLPFGAFAQLVEHSGLPEARVAELADIPRRTLTRRRRDERFSREESDRLVRAARIVGSVLEVFKGDRTVSAAWLLSAQPALSGAVPVALARTDLGAREVDAAIARLAR